LQVAISSHAADHGADDTQGRDTVKQLLIDNPELALELEGKIREKIKEMQNA
jgi:hypothetical protein